MLVFRVKVGFTGDHPFLDDDSEFQAWLAQNTGRRHKFFDGDDVSRTDNVFYIRLLFKIILT